MLLVLEGTDGVGKDTVIDELCKMDDRFIKGLSFPRLKNLDCGTPEIYRKFIDWYFNSDEYHYTSSETGYFILAIDKYLATDTLFKFQQDPNKFYVINRYNLSGVVYSLYDFVKYMMDFKNGVPGHNIKIEKFMDQMKYINSFLINPQYNILITASDKNIEERLKFRNKDSKYDDVEKSLQIQRLYKAFYSTEENVFSSYMFNICGTSTRYTTISNDNSPEETVKEIIQYLDNNLPMYDNNNNIPLNEYLDKLYELDSTTQYPKKEIIDEIGELLEKK